MKICRWDRWTDIKEDRIDSIDVEEFKKLLKEKCHTDQHLYKKIYQPKFKQGIFRKSLKVTESYFETKETTKETKWKAYPIREYSLTCYNYEESGEGVTYLVFPFKDSLFTISPVKESSHDNLVDNYNKGYWKDNIKWLERLNERELWTESDCLVIEKDLYNKIFEYNDYKDTDYASTPRNVLVTTLLGEAGGSINAVGSKELQKILSVINNRSKRSKKPLIEIALKKQQFSVWDDRMNKKMTVSDIIKKKKTSGKWAKKHWELAYKLVDENNKKPILDTTKGANMYFAKHLLNKVKNPKFKITEYLPKPPESTGELNNSAPYWSKDEHNIMQTKKKQWKVHITSQYHVYGSVVKKA